MQEEEVLSGELISHLYMQIYAPRRLEMVGRDLNFAYHRKSPLKVGWPLSSHVHCGG